MDEVGQRPLQEFRGRIPEGPFERRVDPQEMSIEISDREHVEGEIEAAREVERIIGREIEGGSLFLHYLMAAEDQTVGLCVAGLKQEYGSNTNK